MWERIRKHWHTTAQALIPAICAVAAWWSFDIDPKLLGTISAGIYGIILLFSKDASTEG